MLFADGVAILADDLTGANDTALQFHLKGCSTQILMNVNAVPASLAHTQVWAISTESRNMEPVEARQVAKEAASSILKNLNIEHIYKKIDSTLRGNIAPEIIGVLDASDYEAAVIIPAFPNENRITVGGYHLVKGVPIERTEFARDPVAPIYESHIPTVLRNSLDLDEKDLVALIELSTVKQGAGPILNKINELISSGKKLIVCDSVSSVDIEQVILAIQKCNTKILVCGSAGAAQAMCDTIFPEAKYHRISKSIPELPKLIVSGSASELAATQIKRLESDEDVENMYFIEITPEQILGFERDDIIERAIRNLNHSNTVIIHTSSLFQNPDAMTVMLFEKEISRDSFISMICDYLAEITNVIMSQRDAILITVGGETSYKCLEALNSSCLQIIDGVAPAIPLCSDLEARFIVTKSGNLGTTNTLVEVLKYFEK